MALDQSALLDLLAQLKLIAVSDRIRLSTEKPYQELIDAEAHGPRPTRCETHQVQLRRLPLGVANILKLHRVDAEIFRDLLDRHTGFTVPCDANDVTKLDGGRA